MWISLRYISVFVQCCAYKLKAAHLNEIVGLNYLALILWKRGHAKVSLTGEGEEKKVVKKMNTVDIIST
jgi:hypothetical protein